MSKLFFRRYCDPTRGVQGQNKWQWWSLYDHSCALQSVFMINKGSIKAPLTASFSKCLNILRDWLEQNLFIAKKNYLSQMYNYCHKLNENIKKSTRIKNHSMTKIHLWECLFFCCWKPHLMEPFFCVCFHAKPIWQTRLKHWVGLS